MKYNELEDLKQKCILEMARVMSNFQRIERGLKDHITKKYEVINTLLNDKVAFNYSKSNVKNKMLGALIEELSNLTDDKEFIKELKVIVPYRNEIAHERFALITETEDLEYLKETISWLQNVGCQIDQILLRYLDDILTLTITHYEAIWHD